MSQPDAGPFAQWVNLLTSGPTQAMRQWETWMGQQLDRFVRSEPFLERVGKALEGSFHAKAALDRALDQSLRNLRVPPMGDLLDLFRRMDDLERGVDQLGARLADAEATAADRHRALLAALAASHHHTTAPDTTGSAKTAPPTDPPAPATDAPAGRRPRRAKEQA
jgi:hypothetical protein